MVNAIKNLALVFFIIALMTGCTSAYDTTTIQEGIVMDKLFAHPESHTLIYMENVIPETETVLFNKDGVVIISDKEEKNTDYLEIGLSFKINIRAQETDYLFYKRGLGWPNEVSYTFGFQPTNIHVLFSANGSDVDGLFLSGDYFAQNKYYDVLIIFDQGLVKLLVNGEIVETKQLYFTSIYHSTMPIIIGSNFSGHISSFTIKTAYDDQMN